MGLIAKPLGLLLSLIYGIVNNYGVAIVIFTLIVKACLYPAYLKQTKSTIAMSAVQSQIQDIQNRYKGDRDTLNQKMNELYERENYNPAGGCLPMAIQMIIIFGLFSLLRNPLAYMSNSNDMIIAVHSSFLWIQDLSQPDLWILPIAAGILTYVSCAQSQAQSITNPDNPTSEIMLKTMKYVFPVTIIWMGRAFPAGLTIYWFLNMGTQILFNIRFNQMRQKAALEQRMKKAAAGKR